VSTIVNTADLLEAILTLPEPYRTNFRRAWLRLRERNRRIAKETLHIAVLATDVSAEPKGVKALKHELAMTAKARYGKAGDAALALGVSRYTFYRWRKEAA